MAVDGDRSMVTHGHDRADPGGRADRQPPRSRAVVAASATRPAAADVPAGCARPRADGAPGLRRRRLGPTGALGPRRLADQLGGCHAFLPNATEAMAYTRTDTPEAALRALADWCRSPW